MIILSRIVLNFRTHIVVRGPGVRDRAWKVFLCGWTSVAPARAPIAQGIAAMTAITTRIDGFGQHRSRAPKIDHVY
jgi:hypothetical protein